MYNGAFLKSLSIYKSEVQPKYVTIDALKSLCFSYESQTYYVGWWGPGMTEAEGQKVLGPSMIIRRQTATLWELWPTNKSNEDGR